MGLFNRRENPKDEGRQGRFTNFFKGKGSNQKAIINIESCPWDNAVASKNNSAIAEDAKPLLLTDDDDLKPQNLHSRPVHITVDARPKADVTLLRAALNSLPHARGEALVAAAEQDSALADALGALAEGAADLFRDSCRPCGHQKNVIAIANFFLDVLLVLDGNAAKLRSEHADVVRRVLGHLFSAQELVKTWGQPGWLRRMVKSEGTCLEFERLHTAVVSLLHAAGLQHSTDVSLGAPVYEDVAAAVKPIIKKGGRGSIQEGFSVLRDDVTAQEEVATAADVPLAAIAAEAEFDPSAFLSLALIADGPARETECLQVFAEYVTTAADRITADGLQRLLHDLGALDHVPQEQHSALARATLVQADCDFDGGLSFAEFRAMYASTVISTVRSHLRAVAGLAMDRRVWEIFQSYSALSLSKIADLLPSLDCGRFAKLCRECKLFNRNFLAQHVDVVFAAVKSREARRMNFDQFLLALGLIAERQGIRLESVAAIVAAARGPTLHATLPDAVRLHDDRTTYTGVYARGGPDLGAINPDLSTLVARAKPSPTKPKPSLSLPPTHAESPKLATKDRISSPGPTTPGRGASLAAIEARAAAKASQLSTPKGSAFGRCHTPRSATLVTPHASEKYVQSPRNQNDSEGCSIKWSCTRQ